MKFKISLFLCGCNSVSIQMKKRHFIILFAGLSLFSCVKDKYSLDTNNITLSPEIAAPILKASIVADDILSSLDSTLLGQNENNLYEFTFADTVYSMSLADFISIPDENVGFDFSLEPLAINDIPEVTTDITLGSVMSNDPLLAATVNAILLVDPCGNAFPPVPSIDLDTITLPIDDAPFTSATFSNGQLSVELTNGWATPVNNIQLVLKNLSDGTAIDTLVYDEILSGESKSDVVDLAGKTIESDLYGEFINISSAGTNGQTVCVSTDDAITAKINGSNFVVVSGTATFPSQEVLNDTIDVDFDLGNGEQVNTLTMKGGVLGIQVHYEIRESAKLFIELPYATKDGVVFLESISVGGSNGVTPTVVNDTFDLSGYTFDLTKGGTGVNALETRIRANIESSGVSVSFDTSNSVSASVSMEGIEPLYVDGYFGNQSLSIAPETFDFDFGTSEILQKISFADPVVKLGFHNTFGIPMQIDTLNLTMKNDEDSAKLSGASLPFLISGADWANSAGGVSPKTSNLILDKTTNISDLVNLWPNSITTGISAGINPDGDLGGSPTNFAYDNSGMDITLDLTVPLYGSVEGIEVIDTIALDSSIVSIFENVKSASLRSNVVNGFPLEGSVKFYIADENYEIIDSLDTKDGNPVIIAAASVDVNTGEVVSDGVRQADLIADATDISLLQNASYSIIISAIMGTGNDGADVKIYSNYEMDIRLGILAKLSIDLESISGNDNENEE